jgi:outer membrane protein insertion porin family
MAPQDGPLGVRLIVTATPNPVFTKVSLDPPDAKVPQPVVEETFASDLGRTLNLRTLQTRMEELQKWYADQGYSLARVSGPSRISPEGEVQLTVRQGTVAGVEVQFLNKEGSATNDKGQPIRGKTKPWVITREISLKPGQIFNRRNLEEDLKRLYGTGLFSDVKVTLKPEPATPSPAVWATARARGCSARCSCRTATCWGGPGMWRRASPTANSAACSTSPSPIPGSRGIRSAPPSASRRS